MSDDNASQNLDGPRPARPDEIDALLEAADAVLRVSRAMSPSVGRDYPHVYCPENAENILIVKDGEKVVSSTAVWCNTIEFGSAQLTAGGINCVVTLPEYRCRGLGSAVMEACVQRMRDLGCHVGRLGTNITNWYRRMGWESAGCVCRHELNRSNVPLLPSLPPEVTVRYEECPMADSTLDALIALRRADRFGGVRTPELMRTLMDSRGDPKVRNRPRVVLAERGGRAQAYLLERSGGIIEWAGGGELVAALARKWYEDRDDPNASTSLRDDDFKIVFSDTATLIAPEKGHGLADVLQYRAIPCVRNYYGMLYILDARGILDAFGAGDIEVESQDGNFTLTRGQARVTVTPGELAKLLFGPERVREFADDVLPLPFWQWPIEHV